MSSDGAQIPRKENGSCIFLKNVKELRLMIHPIMHLIIIQEQKKTSTVSSLVKEADRSTVPAANPSRDPNGTLCGLCTAQISHAKSLYYPYVHVPALDFWAEVGPASTERTRNRSN